MRREKVKERINPYPNLVMETKRDHHDVEWSCNVVRSEALVHDLIRWGVKWDLHVVHHNITFYTKDYFND